MEISAKNKTYLLSVTALMAAILCILAPLSIPVGPVPISLATPCGLPDVLSSGKQNVRSKLPCISSHRPGRTSCLFRLFRRPRKALRAHGRIPLRLSLCSLHCRYFYRKISPAHCPACDGSGAWNRSSLFLRNLLAGIPDEAELSGCHGRRSSSFPSGRRPEDRRRRSLRPHYPGKADRSRPIINIARSFHIPVRFSFLYIEQGRKIFSDKRAAGNGKLLPIPAALLYRLPVIFRTIFLHYYRKYPPTPPRTNRRSAPSVSPPTDGGKGNPFRT